MQCLPVGLRAVWSSCSSGPAALGALSICRSRGLVPCRSFQGSPTHPKGFITCLSWACTFHSFLFWFFISIQPLFILLYSVSGSVLVFLFWPGTTLELFPCVSWCTLRCPHLVFFGRPLDLVIQELTVYQVIWGSCSFLLVLGLFPQYNLDFFSMSF